ncbi:MAG: DUF2442 domain-containing protein [Planctomycetes bacterium]|nr:DUF2442 domain-containing protein [Planctomycetota bacterium]
MILHVIQAEYISEYMIRLSFNDGTGGMADLSKHLNGAMFEPLKDKRLFRRFRVDNEIGTIVWDNGADLAPEFLRHLAASHRLYARKRTCNIRRKSAQKRSSLTSKSFRMPKKNLTL